MNNLENIKEVLNANKKYIIIAGVLCVAGVILWNVLCGNNVQRNGVGANTVRQQLSTVSNEQSAAIKGTNAVTEGLSNSARQTGVIAGNVADIAKHIEGNQRALSNSSDLIADCQRITGNIRSRGQR